MIKALEALCYLDDIAHGRKMNLDPHELKLIVEKELKAFGILKKVFKSSFTYKYKLENYLECGWITKKEYELLKEELE